MIKAGIVGGAGYTAGELIRLLINHPEVEVSAIHSQSHAKQPITAVHEDLVGDTDLYFSENGLQDTDVIFLCTGHGKAAEYLKSNKLNHQCKIIDLSHDHRLNEHAQNGKFNFAYGLPELNKELIKKSDAVANPGCFATAIQLALLPLAANEMLQSEVHVNAITGSTGAGQASVATTHFSWRNNNISVYKPFVHQHLAEINESLHKLQVGFDQDINFIPVRGNFTRGIFATVYTEIDEDLSLVKQKYEDFYTDSPFIWVSSSEVHLKQVINTNKCLLHLHKHGQKLLVTSIIDNLLKGASGQAVQNMNLMFGLNEKAGLQLKSTIF